MEQTNVSWRVCEARADDGEKRGRSGGWVDYTAAEGANLGLEVLHLFLVVSIVAHEDTISVAHDSSKLRWRELRLVLHWQDNVWVTFGVPCHRDAEVVSVVLPDIPETNTHTL